MALPADSNSLLVPIFLNAWVNDPTVNQQTVARYGIDYTQLNNFIDPIPAPFSNNGDNSGFPTGIYLKWALPDALTHAEQINGRFEFPHVPNRWVVVRFAPGNNQWSMTAWVIQSDYINSSDGTVSFLDPNNPSGINNANDQITVNQTQIGQSYSIEQWTATQDAPLFLKAAGPGNIAFAAFQPFCDNVFSFIDTDLPAPGTGLHNYSYMVVGWYANPAGDPITGVTSTDELNKLLQTFKWSLPGGQPFSDASSEKLPTASLYHGLIADVQWPPPSQADTPPPVVDVAVGNTAADALGALIHNFASIQAGNDPNNKDEWITAGNTLCDLIQAAMLQLLDDYGKPGGQQLVDQQVENSWFGADPGGTIWQVTPVAAHHADFSVAADTLTPAQNKALVTQLATLNAAQQNYDVQQRKLQSLQSQLYKTWLTVVQSNTVYTGMQLPTTVPDFTSVLKPVLINHLYPDIFNEVWQLYCAQATALAALPNPTDADKATQWANENWQFPAADGSRVILTLSDLKLKLKGTAAPAFKHPVDPVVMLWAPGRSMIHGEDGAYNKDGTLTVRLGTQTITGLAANEQPPVTAAAITGPPTNLVMDAFTAITTIPSIPNLLTEAFFCDPLNGPLMAGAVSGTNAATITQCITNLLAGDTSTGTWMGTAPSPVAYSLWQQAWSPLWMEWVVNYYPTTSDTNSDFDMGSWTFDGKKYTLTNVNTIQQTQTIEFTGRTPVSPFAQNVFQTAIENYLQHHPEIDNTILDQLIADVMSWDLLSQSLAGVTAGLLTELAQTSFPPPKTAVTDPAAASSVVPCPAPIPLPTSPTLPLVGDLVQGQYNLLPQLETSNFGNILFPVRGAMVSFGSLQIVDTYGQVITLNDPNTEQGFQPLISPSLTPSSNQIPGFLKNNGPFLLGPRLAQSARLNLDFLANDGSGNLLTAQNNNPICGWLLPNHLDNSLDVYDGDGELLGELLQLPAPNNWRPRPGAPGNNPPPATPEAIPNAALKNVVVTLAAQTGAVFGDFMKVIDETLWMSDPSAGRSDSFMSALIGRPLAVTEMAVSLELNGSTATSQLFDDMLTPTSTATDFTQVHNTGGVEKIPFPVRLGSLQLPGDGLMGYFLQAELNAQQVFPTFYAVHNDPPLSAGDQFIQQIVDNSGTAPTYQGNITVMVNGYGVDGPPVDQVKITMILDPLGRVHAYTGLLPVATAALPPYEVQRFLKKMLVNFQTGPLLAEPGTLRTPKPAEKQGSWDWLQQVHTEWTADAIVDANDGARFPLQPPVIREGWLQLKGITKDNG